MKRDECDGLPVYPNLPRTRPPHPSSDSQVIRSSWSSRPSKRGNKLITKYWNHANDGFRNLVVLPISQGGKSQICEFEVKVIYHYFPQKGVLPVIAWMLSNLKKTQTDWRQGRLKCTQHVLMLPTNLHRPLPWRRCRRAGRPPFLVTCPPIRGRVWSHSSLCLETSGPRLPQRCDECHTQSRSLNLRGKESKTHIIVCVVHSLKWRCCVRTPDTRNSLAWWMDDQGKMQS